jgi:hypothetical protein
MTTEYVSPFDDRVTPDQPLAPRQPSLTGRRVTLLDIRKNRGAEFLDRLEVLLREAGATTTRTAKEIFSKPAALDLIDDIATHSHAVVQALAD